MMKIGLIGGAFNPIHNGHLLLGEHSLNYLKLDRIYLIPSGNPPHREIKIDKFFRLNLLKIALAKLEDLSYFNEFKWKDDRKEFFIEIYEYYRKKNFYDKYEIIEYEINKEDKTYTIDTILYLKEKDKNSEYYLIIGSDQAIVFNTWKRYDEIRNYVNIYCAERNDIKKEIIKENYPYIKFLNFFSIELSSTKIREMIIKEEIYKGYLPPLLELFFLSLDQNYLKNIYK